MLFEPLVHYSQRCSALSPNQKTEAGVKAGLGPMNLITVTRSRSTRKEQSILCNNGNRNPENESGGELPAGELSSQPDEGNQAGTQEQECAGYGHSGIVDDQVLETGSRPQPVV